jgi:hypothetical protein
MKWTKDGANWISRVGDGVFTMKALLKPDGRWDWEVYPRDGRYAIAGGIVNSLGAAKTICENFVNRSGLL